ncbi:glycine zipper family protein [Pseudomonas sp. ZM23]|uniref:Glycine zipper family protein n=1 Tax=Pseudomonas triclosanedens TaxID=2961893 RepID=A0ABY7A073_9PSED|nr:glycine zipper family protein [Pseudomonas triclosanedens]MCP8463991.1 glycine zipper family protein [Pseudomonas triclosanedens]MCP8469075.1 glycine zipper family protein [Pseudomonas triclosanedens]MCP8475797.1 glycine zipper family protein [Pseudomonas triclosanedens]WAI50498.1 glycine zipper family protein [Pseudomonas triclosanedens]
MSEFQCRAPTNQSPNSVSNVPGYLMPARAFFFVVVEEVGKDGFLVRKIYASNKSPYLRDMNLSPLQQLSELNPERYGMLPKDPVAPYSVAEHVMGGGKNISPYISTSSIFPEGSPRFDGRSIFIDISKARQAGLRLISTQEILVELEQYKTTNPHLAKRVDKIASYVRDIDKEVLVQGKKVPASAIFNKDSLKFTQSVARTARVVQVVGIVFTAYDITQASRESVRLGNAKPITAELVRQAGGWGAAWAGLKMGGAVGAAVGIETGPGAVLTGLVGGIVFGAAGYFGADWVADHIYEN